MGMPNLKRVSIKFEQELKSWLASHSGKEDSVMLVTHASASHEKFVSREQVAGVLSAHSWKAGMRYTLGSDLLGHVISRSLP